jgi:hypothetical protein
VAVVAAVVLAVQLLLVYLVALVEVAGAEVHFLLLLVETLHKAQVVVEQVMETKAETITSLLHLQVLAVAVRVVQVLLVVLLVLEQVE